ncbi:MAG: acyltransferase, partial [Calditrichia bacterium]|nr:acyltransferase [Calditrichia bacterium]
DKTPGEKSGSDNPLFGTGKRVLRLIARKFCVVALKFQLREIGSSVRCEGKIRITGTRNIRIGDKSKFEKNVQLKTEGRGYIHIGTNVKVGKGVKIVSTSNVTIEDNSHLGDYVTIRDTVTNTGEKQTQNGTKPVYIGKDVWIGKGTRIHAGITIGNGSTIAANSVVTRSIPPGVIAGGTPVKVIMDR